MFKQICENLYLGDKDSRPKKTNFEIIVADELFITNSNNKKSSYTLIDDKIYFDFYSFSVDINQVRLIVEFMFKKIKTHCIYIHCVFGVNRSPFITFVFLVKYNYLVESTYKKALAKFKQIYPFMGIGFTFLKFIKKYYPFSNL